ncbi:helix-turn-helix domain-containing protein [Nibribacter ruber]|uniref:Helix-turn-helix domain-containing protein n=1 Tax=Nibribacter ruber TaxID=2698458 RepID=A0A6P1NZM1_9BACT|nr:helix-turn-helix transcriptional regulator [Nibribacter ruber]QHL87448.1 helix-turn-helix domain-containing protein [Nibribacter ruber]
MLLGERVKQEIAKSSFKTEEIAEEIGITANNLYRLYKKDSFEIKYLLKICELLNLPVSHFIDAPNNISNSGQIQAAKQVGKNNQTISLGGESSFDLKHQLELCQVEKASLEQRLKDKEELIEVLRSK